MSVKIKTLLEGLSGKGIQLNTGALARFTAENGVLVDISCGRLRGRVSLPPKMYGLMPEKWDEDSKNFYVDHVGLGQLTMVPKELDARLNQLDTRARRLVQSYTINGSYMLLADYEEFKEGFEEIRAEYLDTIDQIANQWADIRDSFITGVRTTVEARGKGKVLKRDREKIIAEITKAIPTAREYRERAYMKVEVRAFPTTGASAPGLAPDMQNLVNQTWRDDVTANVVKAIETAMGEIFEKACVIAKGYAKSGKVDLRSLNTLNRRAARVQKMNVFANPLLEEVADALSKLTNDGDDDAAEMKIEDAIISVWAYAEKTGVNLDLKVCPFDEDTLNSMLALRTSAAV